MKINKPTKAICSVDPDQHLIEKLCKDLIGAKIRYEYKLTLPSGSSFSNTITDSNINGNCIEHILFPYIHSSISTFEQGPKQKSPDFWNRNREYCWEIKAFSGNAGFDVANFISFVHQLSISGGVQEKLYKTKYLVFKYQQLDDGIEITDFTMCNVWNLINYNGKYPISLQNKKGTWYNIRPGAYDSFSDSKKTSDVFIDKICQAITECPNTIKERDQLIDSIKKQMKKITEQTS